jgi:hypothetical protein
VFLQHLVLSLCKWLYSAPVESGLSPLSTGALSLSRLPAVPCSLH